jgi:hypothetical protein
MKAPICNVLSLALPAVVGSVGFYLARTAKGATNMGEALGPLFAAMIVLMASAVAGEAAAVASLLRGERLAWLSWLGIAVNGLLLLPLIVLLLTADWTNH